MIVLTGATLYVLLHCRAFKSVAIRGRMIELASYFGTINLAMEDGCALAISCLGMCPITLSLMISPHFSSKMTHNPPLGWQIPVLASAVSSPSSTSHYRSLRLEGLRPLIILVDIVWLLLIVDLCMLQASCLNLQTNLSKNKYIA